MTNNKSFLTSQLSFYLSAIAKMVADKVLEDFVPNEPSPSITPEKNIRENHDPFSVDQINDLQIPFP